MKKKLIKSLLMISFVVVATVTTSKTTYAWDSKNSRTELSTHSMITEQALNILTKDLSNEESNTLKNNLSIITKYAEDLKYGSVYPDYDPKGYKLYQDHFYDPDTGNNFTKDNSWYVGGKINDTASTQGVRYVRQALDLWKNKDYQNSVLTLGYALHYIEDINCPYHAANITAMDSVGHTEYEKYNEKNKLNYKITTLNTNTLTQNSPYVQSLEPSYISDLIKTTSYNDGKISKDMYYKYSTMKNSYSDWDYSGKAMIENSQKEISTLIYRFLKEVSGETKTPPSDIAIGDFNVILDTANESMAGSNDYIYFGFETSSGKKFEYLCSNAGAFAQGSTDNFNFTIDNKDIKSKDITNIWIRKKNYLAGDDWKLSKIKIYMKDSNVFEGNINSWLKNNDSYNIKVPGLVIK